MKRGWRILVMAMLFCLGLSSLAFAGAQDVYKLPEPYMGLEQSYLKAYPDLQKVMDIMITETAKQLKNPTQDILHNRVCSALVYKMSVDNKLGKKKTRLAVAGDLLHNICKADKTAVMTDPEYVTEVNQMVINLRKAGYLKNSPEFWTNTKIYANPKLGNNLGLIHHLTGAVVAGKWLQQAGFSKKDITELQAGIVEHSTGYWYFRASVNAVTGTKDGWKEVYPAPENNLAKYIHDADLISQFVPESVTPDGSKWRNLATKRWGAKNTQEQGQIVYYVFMRLYDEAKTPSGKKLAKEKWDQIAPQLVKLMGLQPGTDPIKTLGVPKVFQGQ